MKKKYNIIYSIGQDCACSIYMKKTQIRCCSGPFDWLTNANLETRFNLILNDFSDFLNKEDLVVMPKPTQFPADKNNEYYKNIKTDFYFWHDFPADIEFEKSFLSVKEKYNRRIQRFYKNITTKEKVLLIYFSHNNLGNDNTILQLCNQICKKFSKKIDFLFIGYDESKKDNEIECYNLSDNITIYKLNTRDVDEKGQPTTLGKTKLCLPLFAKFEIIMPIHKKILRQFLYILSYIICIFILSKPLRKRVREYLRR